VQCKRDGLVKPCALTAPAHSGTVTFSAPTEGGHTFQVNAFSPNASPSERAAIVSWVVDTVAPDTVLDPTVGPGEAALQTMTCETFKLGSTEPVGATDECSLDDARFAACSTPLTLDGLSPGRHSFQTRTIDRAGNVDAISARGTGTIAFRRFRQLQRQHRLQRRRRLRAPGCQRRPRQRRRREPRRRRHPGRRRRWR
jgi:hypothetical protein